MKYILFLLSCLIISPAFAETIGDVEYQLPTQISQDWEIANKLECPKGTTVVYIPKGNEAEKAREFFGVNSNTLTSDLNNIDSLKAYLSTMYPENEIDFSVVEKTDNSLTYEWSSKENGEEKVHGFGRVFSTKEGTVVMGYQTEKVSDIANAKSLWLPILKEAKLKNSEITNGEVAITN